MVPVSKEELRKMVSQTTIETYEELTPQLISLIQETNAGSCRPLRRSSAPWSP